MQRVHVALMTVSESLVPASPDCQGDAHLFQLVSSPVWGVKILLRSLSDGGFRINSSSRSGRTPRQLASAAAGETFPRAERRARNLLGARCLPGGGGGCGASRDRLARGGRGARSGLGARGWGSGGLARLRGGSLGAASAPQPGAPESPAAAAEPRWRPAGG